jgi:large subunit ribosomal protein L6
MSRIGAKPVTLPSTVTVSVTGQNLVVKGPKGELSVTVPPGIKVEASKEQLVFSRTQESIQTKAYHGLIRSQVYNMVTGVTDGYLKKLELLGTGYRAKVQGDKLVLNLGFSHQIEYVPPDGIKVSTEGDTLILVTGIDKQKVGQAAANIRGYRPPEPYKGKGVRYQGEQVRRKAGKAAKVGAAA